MTLKELFTNIANAIRSATGATGTIKATDFASKISAITNRGAWTSTINAGGSVTVPAGYHNGSGKVTANANSGNAGTSQVLSGYTFYSNSATKQTGTMTNRGAVSTTIAPGGSYTIPQGYHNGSGKVSASSSTANNTLVAVVTGGGYAQIDCGANVNALGVGGAFYCNSDYSEPSISIQGSKDGSTWTTFASNSKMHWSATLSAKNVGAYRYYRAYSSYVSNCVYSIVVTY